MAHSCAHFYGLDGRCVHCHGATIAPQFRGMRPEDGQIVRVGRSARSNALTHALYAESKHIRRPFSRWAQDNADKTLRKAGMSLD